MLTRFYLALRAAGIPASLTEFLTLLEALQRGVIPSRIDAFYQLARTILVKDERHYDRFDRAFGAFFDATAPDPIQLAAEIPADWLRRQFERHLSEEEKRRVQALGGWQRLIDTLRERLREQDGAHHGGSKWIGTGGTSPFGAYGYHPEGVRIGQRGGRERRAVKVWERRDYANLADDVELGTRNFKVALRRLRRFAREGAPEQLDLDDTIRATARNAGLLDLRMVPERHNAVKVLLLLDVGGSMDEHVRDCETLFSAARSEFRHLRPLYFHNCVYEQLWTDAGRRAGTLLDTREVLRTYAADYRLILVGDAAMSPYEIAVAGGSVDHWNEEPGAVWLRRLLAAYPHAVWLNPLPREHWERIQSIAMIRRLMSGRMFTLTPAGLEEAIRELGHRAAERTVEEDSLID